MRRMCGANQSTLKQKRKSIVVQSFGMAECPGSRVMT
jgi:hypothetical protein